MKNYFIVIKIQHKQELENTFNKMKIHKIHMEKIQLNFLIQKCIMNI